MGVLCALIALVGWALADYYIQKSSRITGTINTVFINALTGVLVLLPFVFKDLIALQKEGLILLSLLGVIAMFEVIFDVGALKQGKISIVEPVFGLELPLTVALSVTLAKENLTTLQSILIFAIAIGIILTITTKFTNLHNHRSLFERGVLYAGLGAIGLALTNFLVGVASQEISPLLAVWFTDIFALVIVGMYIFYQGGFRKLFADFRHYPKQMTGQGIFNEIAWVGFAFATTMIPISIATAISESYVALTVLLGIFISREKIKRHQIIGIILAVTGIIILSYLFV